MSIVSRLSNGSQMDSLALSAPKKSFVHSTRCTLIMEPKPKVHSDLTKQSFIISLWMDSWTLFCCGASAGLNEMRMRTDWLFMSEACCSAPLTASFHAWLTTLAPYCAFIADVCLSGWLRTCLCKQQKRSSYLLIQILFIENLLKPCTPLPLSSGKCLFAYWNLIGCYVLWCNNTCLACAAIKAG